MGGDQERLSQKLRKKACPGENDQLCQVKLTGHVRQSPRKHHWALGIAALRREMWKPDGGLSMSGARDTGRST